MSRLVNREQYFEYALEVLASSGFKGLNIGVLCKNLGVTSGSFYHHFGSWQAFVDALLAFWENQQVLTLREWAFGDGDPEGDITKLRNLTLALNHKAEAAIRAWSANVESVRQVQRRVDDARRKTAENAIATVVGDRETANSIASLGLVMLIGYQQLEAAGHPDDLKRLLDEYLRLIAMHADAAPKSDAGQKV